MVEVRAQLQAPREAQQEVERDGGVVDRGAREDEAFAEPERGGGGVGMGMQGGGCAGEGLVDGGEEAEIPVLGHVPVEAVHAVYEHGGQPEPIERCFRDADVLVVEREVSLECGEDDDREGGRVFQRVGEVLAAPSGLCAHAAVLDIMVSDAHVFDEALTEPDERGDRDDYWDEVLASAPSVWTRGCGAVGPREEHA